MSDVTVDEKEVKKIAEQLCAFSLPKEQLKEYSNALAETLNYIEVLEELDTSEVDETYQVTGAENVFMSEEGSENGLSQEETLSNADEQKDGLFVTGGVFDR